MPPTKLAQQTQELSVLPKKLPKQLQQAITKISLSCMKTIQINLLPCYEKAVTKLSAVPKAIVNDSHNIIFNISNNDDMLDKARQRSDLGLMIETRRLRIGLRSYSSFSIPGVRSGTRSSSLSPPQRRPSQRQRSAMSPVEPQARQQLVARGKEGPWWLTLRLTRW